MSEPECSSSYALMDLEYSDVFQKPKKVLERWNLRPPSNIVVSTIWAIIKTPSPKEIGVSGYGKFHTFILIVSGMIYATCAISSTAISFVLPSAECDFDLSSVDKGKLSATPLLGMIFGCTLWGSLANSYGRRVALILTLFVDFLACFTSAFVHNFGIFLALRFINGFATIGAISIVFPYLGEFVSKKQRDVVLGRLEIFWNVGMIILPGFAWILLNKDFLEWFGDRTSFSPWRIFVLVCSFPSLLSLSVLYCMPETPKFLISKQRYIEARQVFERIFTFNTGRPLKEFPIIVSEWTYQAECYFGGQKESPKNKFYKKLEDIADQMKHLFCQPYLKYLAICCFVDFGLMSSYYTLVMWFPEIFDRFNEYEANNPNATASVCVISENKKDFDEFLPYTCEPAINERVFIDTMIIGFSCIPTSVSLSYFMEKFGKQFVLVFALVLSGISTLSLNFVNGTTQTLALSCVFESLTSISEAVIFCVIVDLFPTNLRATALVITASFGRVGAICGNIVFGLLIDLNCVLPIYLFGCLLLGSAVFCMALPNRRPNYISIS